MLENIIYSKDIMASYEEYSSYGDYEDSEEVER